VPHEASKIFEQGILANPNIQRYLPVEDVAAFAPRVTIVGHDAPSVPINWRFAESAAALKALEACLIATLVKRKDGLELSGGVEIDSDHASLAFMSPLIYTVNPGTEDEIQGGFYGANLANLDRMIPNYDIYNCASSAHRINATNIYQTKDGRFFHLHGGLNPDPTLASIGLPAHLDADDAAKTLEEALAPFIQRVAQFDSQELDRLVAETYRQPGCICQSVEAYRESEHGKANAQVGLFEIHDRGSDVGSSNSHAKQPPSWWPAPPPSPTASPDHRRVRPLAGLKVVDLTWIVAGPMVTRGLAELGASVMRVTSPTRADYSRVHMDTNWGKWNGSLNLADDPDGTAKARLRELIADCDVVVQGYRPGALDRFGLGQQDIIDLVADRPRGIVSVRINSYGWHGPLCGRPGWQDISDAHVGISTSFGKALGSDEPVTPPFPNSDCMTGLAGVAAVLCALLQRGRKGGSYKVDLALDYYNQWLAESVGEYPPAVWEDLWTRNGRPVFR
jgi:crotonobetainyl-CoA:carnitine CoA-transferase CaiB-like acyl-CoA transferase